jgi:Spy/CpxP family protein refolding chaperone
MKSTAAFFLVVIGVATVSAIATRLWIEREPPAPESVHEWLHARLDLSAEQDEALEQIEERFAAQEKPLREAFAAANRDLAVLIREEGAFTPNVASAVENVHHRMGELQKLSLEHLFTMASILDPAQKETLIHYAEMALTEFP